MSKNMNRMQIGERLKNAREKLNISRKEASEYANIGTTTIQQWESGSREASIEAIEKLAQLYKVTPNYLIFGEQQTTATESEPQFDRERMYDKEFAKRIQIAVNKIGNEKMVNTILNISAPTIGRWKDGTSDPKMSNMVALAKASGVSLDWLLMGQGEIETEQQTTDNNNEYYYIPVYDIEVSAGHGLFSDGATKPKKHLAYRKDWIDRKGLDPQMLAVVYNSGDSMENTIPDQASMLINLAKKQVLDGKIYVLRIEDRLYVKRTQWMPVIGSLRIISDNPIYESFDISKQDLQNEILEVCGEVIHVGYDI